MIIKDDDKIFMARSKLRRDVLYKLNDKPQIASFLAKDMNKHRESISRVFLDLESKEIAKCSNPKSSNFRFYQITSKGKKLLDEIK
jgi:DNA-binding PadR family transcriptional regulator